MVLAHLIVIAPTDTKDQVRSLLTLKTLVHRPVCRLEMPCLLHLYSILTVQLLMWIEMEEITMLLVPALFDQHEPHWHCSHGSPIPLHLMSHLQLDFLLQLRVWTTSPLARLAFEYV